MPLPRWTKDYAFGSNLIDEEHRHLFELLEWLERELFLEHDLDSGRIAAVAKELNYHVDEHFFHEEALMSGLPGLTADEKEAHARDHERWKLRIKEHLPALLRARTDLERRAHLAQVVKVGKALWEQHFLTFDRRVGEALAEKK